MDRVLKLAAAIVKQPGEDPDIFEMQALLEGCCDELRTQIREMAEGAEK
jgi:hypothetical protein